MKISRARTRIAFVALLTAILLIMGACQPQVTSSKLQQTTVAPQTTTAASPGTTVTTVATTAKAVPTIDYLINFEPGYELRSDSEAILYWGGKTGVKFNIINPPRDSFADRVSTTLVSGDLPDMIHFFRDVVTFKKYGPDLFVAVDEYMDKGQLPNLKKWYEKYPVAVGMMEAPDKHIYGFPQFADYSFSSFAIVLRGDLLRKGGYEADQVKTLDDLKKAFKAVKDQAGRDNIMINRHGLSYFFAYSMPMFGITQDVYYDDDPGGSKKFVFAPELPRFKAYVEFCRYLYENKILHPDFATSTDQEWDAAFANLEVSAMFTEPSRWNEFDKRATPALPDGAFVAFLLPPEIDGKRYAIRKSPPLNIGFRWPVVIDKKSQYIEDCVRAMDYIYTEEGRYDLLYGPKGQYWTFDSSYPSGIRFDVEKGLKDKIVLPQLEATVLKDGKKMEDVVPADAKELLNLGYGWYISGVIPEADRLGYNGDLPGNTNGLVTKEAIKFYEDNGALKDPEPSVQLTDAEFQDVARIRTAIQTSVQENVLRFINGQKPLSEFDAFIGELKKMNSEKLVEIYNAALGRMSK